MIFWPAFLALVAGSMPLHAASKEQSARGAELFVSSGCQHCHTIGNMGGHRGPNLSNMGAHRKEKLRSAIKLLARQQSDAGFRWGPRAAGDRRPHRLPALLPPETSASNPREG